jgi:hypothetical protein
MNLILCEAAVVDVKPLTLHPGRSTMDRSQADDDGNDLRSSHIYILHQRSVYYEHHLTELHMCKMWDLADFICPYSIVNT